MNALVMNCSPVRTGATARIVQIVSAHLESRYQVKSVCIDDFHVRFCKGCRSCHTTAKCVQQDDVIVSVSPSYWADVPGQFKVFIDRCTPWSNTHQPHAAIRPGKRGYSIVLRTGPGMGECERIIQTLEHFYGHLEIDCCGSLGLCSIEYKEAVEARKDEIRDFCRKILNAG